MTVTRKQYSQEYKLNAVELSNQRSSPRIAKELTMQNIKASEVLVVKLMRANAIKSIIRKKYVITTDSKHKYPVVWVTIGAFIKILYYI